MTVRPIIMSAPMVRALLDGRKTQTRRLAWRAAKQVDLASEQIEDYELRGYRIQPLAPPFSIPAILDLPFLLSKPTFWQSVEPGDLLYVRENHAFVGGGDPGLLLCQADWRETAERLGCENIPDKHPRWTPSIHMPRWASRLTLAVTAVKREPVQDISHDDAIAEGCSQRWTCLNPLTGIYVPENEPVDDFECLWGTLHKPGKRWEDNPEVMVLEFTVHQRNIDAMERAA